MLTSDPDIYIVKYTGDVCILKIVSKKYDYLL